MTRRQRSLERWLETVDTRRYAVDDFRVWTGPVGLWLPGWALRAVSPLGFELWAALLGLADSELDELGESIAQVVAEDLVLIEGTTYCVPASMAALVERTGLDHVELMRCRRELEDAGLLGVMERGGGRHGRRSNVYAVVSGRAAR